MRKVNSGELCTWWLKQHGLVDDGRVEEKLLGLSAED